MNWILRISVYLIAFAVAHAEVELRDEDYNKTWMYMPNGEGEMEVAYLVEPPAEHDRSEISEFIQFEFYDSSNPDKPVTTAFSLLEGPTTSTTRRRKRETWEELADRFKPDINTKILVHGWKSSSRSNSIQAIRNAYTERGNVNVFAINWSDQADNIYYLEPARYTVQVGRAVAQLIDLLVEEKDADPKSIHLIGHSLGAHIMGYAGSYTKYRLGRITGLDPARPAFEGSTGPENHLDVTDAEFVDVIHTCAGILGYKQPIGVVDFYPNGGGAFQPGCNQPAQIFTGCSHGRSCEYFAESINSKTGFLATACNSVVDAKAMNCTGQRILMGDPVLQNARGIYSVKTADKPNFALGMEG
ncbi:PREDICTED: inactive pancreatic lipase-related protein 1-like [Rhagoletis zephyria]|uniref:inactive pancreatic lipase-related protein 1-like n=1 Tax=Rhagoletis zephyria TaxID=28612 RepID=UPI00081167CA|nr:PREDICTED: inactive pancreatic lipase-related protein 1-like [Rhagoletis zephyria]